MPNVSDSISSGVTFTPGDGSAKHSYDDFSLYLVEPTYSTRKRKEVLVNLPYMDGVLDFSDQFERFADVLDRGDYYYEAEEVSYRFVRQFQPGASGAQAMRQAHAAMETFFWKFKGDIADDYGKTFAQATCTALTVTPHPVDNTLELEVKFRAKYSQ